MLAKESLYQGFFRMSRVSFRYRLFDGGWSNVVRRELFERGQAVGILLYDPWHHLVGLIQQFRVGAIAEPEGPWQFEIVAGITHEGEDIEEVARRELREEAGVTVEELLPICRFLVSGGATDEKLHLYCGIADLREHGGVFGLDHEDEDILFSVWPYDEAVDAFEAGHLNNAPVTIAMLWLQLNWRKLCDERQSGHLKG